MVFQINTMFVFLSALLFVSSVSAGWALEDDYSTSNFFGMFSFWNSDDPTHGFVDYVDQSTAQSSGLISTSSNGVYIGVDYQNEAPNGRPSVRLTSNKAYNSGSLVILDLQHMPGGICGTWPAFWTVGPNWPAGGEIDIIEGVHQQTTNDMTLHTGPGCSISNTGGFSGNINSYNCDINAAGQGTNQGCQVGTPNSATYGSSFNANGGGVYALEWTDDAISIYFFQRGSIPSDVSSGSPDPSSWGNPVAKFEGSCDIPQFFQNNQLVFDTTFCGDWAGATWSTSGCASTQYPTCESFVQNNPSAFKDAYWQVNSLKVYSESSGSDSTPVSSSAPSASSSANVPVTTAASTAAASPPQQASSDTPAATTAQSAPEATSAAAAASTSSSTSSDDSGAVVVGSNGQVQVGKQVENPDSASAIPTPSAAQVTSATQASPAAAATTDDTPALDAIVEVNDPDGTVELEDQGHTRRWQQRPARRNVSQDSHSDAHLRRRQDGERIQRMRHVRNVGSHGRWRH